MLQPPPPPPLCCSVSICRAISQSDASQSAQIFTRSLALISIRFAEQVTKMREVAVVDKSVIHSDPKL